LARRGVKGRIGTCSSAILRRKTNDTSFIREEAPLVLYEPFHRLSRDDVVSNQLICYCALWHVSESIATLHASRYALPQYPPSRGTEFPQGSSESFGLITALIRNLRSVDCSQVQYANGFLCADLFLKILGSSGLAWLSNVTGES